MAIYKIMLIRLLMASYSLLLSRWNVQYINKFHYKDKFIVWKRILRVNIVKNALDFIFRMILEYFWFDLLFTIAEYVTNNFIYRLSFAITFRILIITIIHLVIRYKSVRD